MKVSIRPLALACLAVFPVLPCAASSVETPAPASLDSSPWQVQWNLRARHEQVDSDAFSREAHADTVRLRLGLRAQFANGWRGLVEANGVAAAGSDYNSGANGHLQYPTIADPRGGELSQAWIGWQNARFGINAGRQALVFDNQRWVNDAGWRQHQQSYDAVAMNWQPAAGWTVRYAWLDRQHRAATRKALSPLARERHLDSHLFNVKFEHARQSWVGYAYLHEDRDLPAASSATTGVRWVGSAGTGGFGWQLELARQTDYANNPLHFNHDYWLLEPNWTLGGTTLRAGWEHLGGDGHTALQTPLTAPHAFNGWDDQFATTPLGGLEDHYLGAGGKLPSTGTLAWNVAWHDFRGDRGGHYGREWDASLSRPMARGISALVKAARYRADGFGRNDTKLWLQLEWSGGRDL